ncbi:hypothetical protein MKX03_035213 [Papaver bracteatum]|nr:hypothetical protein MKX03_035213 [Papaver bracteatum]
MIPAFLVGDNSLRFVYDPYTTNVMEITYCDFKSCNPISPLATYNTGNDIVLITKLHQYFISGNHVECNNGLKVNIPAFNSSLVRFLRSSPAGPDGYVNVPKFEDTPTEGANTAEDMSCVSDSSPGGASASTPAMSPRGKRSVGLRNLFSQYRRYSRTKLYK